MNKADLVTRITKEADLTKHQSEHVVDVLLEQIQIALSRGEHVTFSTIFVFPRSSSLCPNWRIRGLNCRAVIAGQGSALRTRAFPIFDKRVRPCTWLPDSYSRAAVATRMPGMDVSSSCCRLRLGECTKWSRSGPSTAAHLGPGPAGDRL